MEDSGEKLQRTSVNLTPEAQEIKERLTSEWDLKKVLSAALFRGFFRSGLVPIDNVISNKLTWVQDMLGFLRATVAQRLRNDFFYVGMGNV